MADSGETKDAMFERLDDLSSQLDTAIIGTLSALGWRHTSATPDCVWRWVKQLPDGTMLMCDQRSALSVERNYL